MNKYQKVKMIGEGSFGKAFLVRDKQSNKQYVIKVSKSIANILIILRISAHLANSLIQIASPIKTAAGIKAFLIMTLVYL